MRSLYIVFSLLLVVAPARADAQIVGAPPAVQTDPGWLGVGLADQNGETAVTAVFPGSPAAAAGIEVGDVLTAIDGVPVGAPGATVDAISGHPVGETVSLSIRRDDATSVVSAVLGERVAPTDLARSLVGSPFPFAPVTLVETGGTLSALPDAELTIVEFWATWCGPCQIVAPQIDAMTQRYGNRISMLAVSREARGDVARFVASTDHIGWPTAVDDGRLGGAAYVYVLPTWFVINADGEVVSVHVGANEIDALETSVEQHMRLRDLPEVIPEERTDPSRPPLPAVQPFRRF